MRSGRTATSTSLPATKLPRPEIRPIDVSTAIMPSPSVPDDLAGEARGEADEFEDEGASLGER